ncbi:MAG: PP2C family protein-serine/threonine phosphatase [Candidatus Acidiferrales bacterium]
MTLTEQAAAVAALPRILVADDQPHIGEAISLLLRTEGFHIELADAPERILRAIEAGSFDAVLMDLNYSRDTTSGEEGLNLISHLQTLDSTLPIVVMTAWGSVPLAVEAMRRGARDFVLKPWENDQLLRTMRAQVELGRAMRQDRRQQIQKDQEWEEARRIQQRLLPEKLPKLRGCEMVAQWRPALLVGGDYFDVLKFSDETAGLCIADVCGKGLPAALLMANLQAAVRAHASPTTAPAQLCEQLNRMFCSVSAHERFITLFYGFLDLRHRTLVYSNAGHAPGLLVRRNNRLIRLGAGGPLLGEFEGLFYEQGHVQIEPGDRLVLYTDGVPEAPAESGEEFGEKRLAHLITTHRELPAAALQEKLWSEVLQFCDGQLRDDATLIVLAVD